MVLQVFVSKHSSVVCQQHPVDKLKAGEQFSPTSHTQKKEKKHGKYKEATENVMSRMSGSAVVEY